VAGWRWNDEILRYAQDDIGMRGSAHVFVFTKLVAHPPSETPDYGDNNPRPVILTAGGCPPSSGDQDQRDEESRQADLASSSDEILRSAQDDTPGLVSDTRWNDHKRMTHHSPVSGLRRKGSVEGTAPKGPSSLSPLRPKVQSLPREGESWSEGVPVWVSIFELRICFVFRVSYFEFV
jgi:hypothetical protein